MPVFNHQEPLDSIEASLVELAEAQRAGVFGRTRLPSREAPEIAPIAVRFTVRSLRRLAIAAVIVFAMGVWSLMFRSNLSKLRERSRSPEIVQVVDLSAMQASIALCIAGPRGTVDPACGRVDFDGDGDVDLGDISAFQRSMTVATR